MIWTKIKRGMRAGFTGFWRNGFVSLASVVVMIIALSVILGVLLSSALFTATLEQIKNRVDINVYFATNAGETDILALKKNVEKLPEVLKVEYISRDQAMTDFRKKHEGDQTLIQAIDELGDNPLGASLNIKAKEPSQYGSIAEFLKGKNALSSDGLTIIDKINYYDNKAAIDRLSYVIESGKKIGFSIALILGLLSLLVTFNTIRLAIYTARDEIGVMKLVGASNRYIRGPFVITGIMYGLISGMTTLVLFYPIAYVLGPKTEQFFTGVNIFSYFLNNFGQLFLVVMSTGIFIGAVSSYLSVKRYLNV